MNAIYHAASTRGRVRLDWLDSHHTFSFGSYHNPERIGFGRLRVLNDDVVQPGAGFATHSHRDMEIVSVPLNGALEHKDSAGHAGIIRTGDVQRMSAGMGISHSEFNPSPSEDVNFLQIWILPEKLGLEPGYEQRHFNPEEYWQKPRLLVSPDGREDSLAINQQSYFSRLTLPAGETSAYCMHLAKGGLYLFMIEGRARIGSQQLGARDGLAISGADVCQIAAESEVDVLLIEIPL